MFPLRSAQRLSHEFPPHQCRHDPPLNSTFIFPSCEPPLRRTFVAQLAHGMTDKCERYEAETILEFVACVIRAFCPKGMSANHLQIGLGWAGGVFGDFRVSALFHRRTHDTASPTLYLGYATLAFGSVLAKHISAPWRCIQAARIAENIVYDICGRISISRANRIKLPKSDPRIRNLPATGFLVTSIAFG